MLVHLAISNFAIVDRLALDFDGGMTVITGETGAGKSIMLDALGLALGDRLESGVIGSADRPCEINASFEITGYPDVVAWLGERDLRDEEGDLCILRRVVTGEGRSRGYINGRPSTMQDLRELGEMLLDIHSQHEHQSLLQSETQRRLVDEFGNLTAETARVAEHYDRWHQAAAELVATAGSSDQHAARTQLLTYQISELADIGLREGEYEELEAEHKLLTSAESRIDCCKQVVSLLAEGDAPLADQLTRAIGLLREIDDERLGPTLELLTSSQIQLEEAGRDLERYLEHCEVNPERLAEVEQRIGAVYDLGRKHRRPPRELHALEKELREELAGLNDLESKVERLTAEVEASRKQFLEDARALHDKRKKSAKTLEKKVTGLLKSLSMGGATFEVTLTELDESHALRPGLTGVEFEICTNPGQPLRPLRRIASGGELSRISLAIQVAVAHTSRIPTLVFDEVDVGIGGAVAEVVGTLLRQLGRQGQILCVTHLPQVAAQGHQHLVVTKHTKGRQTETQITALEKKARINEIARMLGGVEMTEQSLAHAKEMFEKAQK